MSKNGWKLRSGLALIGAFIALVFTAPHASGHAIVRSTTPEIDEVVEDSPADVVMEFNEPIEINFGAIRVFDTHAKRVDRGAASYVSDRNDAARISLEPNLPEGTYTVAWNIISADGHPIEEAFVFHVGHAGARSQGVADEVLGGEAGGGRAETTAFAVVRWLNFTALVVLVGAFLFRPLIWARRGFVDVRPPQVEARFESRQRTLLIGAWFVVLIATVAGFLLQGVVAAQQSWSQALSPDLMEAVANTRYGRIALLKLALLVVIAAWWMAIRSSIEPPRTASVGAAARPARVIRGTSIVGVIFAVALLATPGLAGHAATTSPALLNVAIDVSHLIGTSAWIGGLVVLLIAALPATRALSVEDRTGILAPIIGRFSDIAFWSVLLIVATGVYAAWIQVQGLSVVLSSSYGIALLVKLSVFLPLIALGGINKRWMKPRLKRAALVGGTAAPLGLFKRLIVAEVGLAALVIAVTAVLVNLAPARTLFEQEDGFRERIKFGDRMYVLSVDPNRVGRNEVELMPETMGGAMGEGSSDDETSEHTESTDRDRGPKEVTVLFRMPEQGIGPLPVKARQAESGHFIVTGHQLSVPGRWRLEIVVRTGRFEEHRREISLDVDP
jgi:copper transport protein